MDEKKRQRVELVAMDGAAEGVAETKRGHNIWRARACEKFACVSNDHCPPCIVSLLVARLAIVSAFCCTSAARRAAGNGAADLKWPSGQVGGTRPGKGGPAGGRPSREQQRGGRKSCLSRAPRRAVEPKPGSSGVKQRLGLVAGRRAARRSRLPLVGLLSSLLEAGSSGRRRSIGSK